MFNLITLETDKVKLTPLTQDHLTGLLEAGNHPDIWRWVFNNYCKDSATLTTWFEQTAQFDSKNQLVMAIICKQTNNVVGTTRLFRLDEHNMSAEIGHTFIAKSAQRTHINTHAKYLLLNYAFERLKLVRVTFCTHENNLISRNAIARLGARFEGLAYKQRKLMDGSYRNTAIFSITDDLWPTVRGNLLQKAKQTELV